MIRYYLFLIVLLLSHISLVYSRVLPGVFKNMLILDAAIGIIFLISILVAHKGIKGDPESFVWRFLIVTTFQLLASLTVIIVLIFKQKEEAFAIGISGTILALLLLIAQSILLFRQVNKN